jgi:hypothetical protein
MNDIRNTKARTEATLADLSTEIWAGRGFVLGGLVCGMFAALVLVFLAVPHSRAQMVLAPASPMDDSAALNEDQRASNALSQATLNFERFQSVAKGAAVASLLLRSPDIVRGLDADQDFVFSGGGQDWRPENLAEYISKHVQFVPVGETSLRALRYLHPDPAFAAGFLQRLHTITDGVIRHNVRTEVGERISYLQQELQKVLNPDHRRALTDLLMEQERLRMLVSIDQPYAALVVEPAYSSSNAVWPDVPLVFSAFGVLGAFLGFVVFSIRNAARFTEQHSEEAFSDDLFAEEARQAKERLKELRRWTAGRGENTNERPLTGKGKNKKKGPPPFSSNAAE